MDKPTNETPAAQPQASSPQPHRRRARYPGKYPRRFEQKYKEHSPERFSDTVRKVIDSGKTPAGTHRPIMVEEVLAVLAPRPGELAVDCTLGYGGHARALLQRLLPGGRLVGLDQDSLELPKTEARFRAEGFGPEVFTAVRINFGGLREALRQSGAEGADVILADLGVSSMQLDNPARGFSVKEDGPLDMRMNPARGQTASALLAGIASEKLTRMLVENADEPFAGRLAAALAGQRFESTKELAGRIRTTLPSLSRDEVELSIRRTFQALRVAVNDEFAALDSLLRQLPSCLKPGGRVAILTFHSGEDRRVKKSFKDGLLFGLYNDISSEVIRPGPAERHANPRSAPAKLRWARASASVSG